MKGFWLFALCLVSFTVLAAQEDVDVQKTVSASAGVGVYSAYVGQYSGVKFENHAVEQGNVNVTFSEFTFGLWNNASLVRRAGETSGDELDYSLIWSTSWGSLNSEIGLTYYDLSKLCRGRENNVWAPTIKISREIQGDGGLNLEPYLRLEADFADNRSEFSGGTFVTIGCSCEG